MYTDYNLLGWLAGIVMGALAFFVIIGILLYVLGSLGLMTAASKRGIEHAWLAWIPLANLFVLGRIADEYNKRIQNKHTNNAILLLVLGALELVFALLPVPFNIFGIILAIVLLVFTLIAYYKVFDWCSTNAVLFIVLSIFFSFLLPIFLFAVRNGENPRYASYPPTEKGGAEGVDPNRPPQM